MKTVMLKIMNEIDLSYELGLFNSVLRFAYNRFHDDPSIKEKEVRSRVNSLFKGKLNSWLIQCAIKDAKAVQDANGDKKVIFGGKYLYRRYLRKLIDKETFKSERLLPMSSQGEMLHNGNRLFDFNFDEQKLCFKISRTKHIDIQLGNLHRKRQIELNKLNELCRNKQATVSVKINNENVWITYDEKLIDSSLKFKELKKSRVLGIDLNPNYIGLSVLEFDSADEFKILHKQVFGLKLLTDKKTKSSKRDYELIQISHQIKDLVNYWKCSKLVVEDLSIKMDDKHNGKTFNRLCNNIWNRNLVINKLKMLSNVYGFEFIEINPAYTSFIGNVLHGDDNTPDMIAASIEIARRGYKKYTKGWFYPVFNVNGLDERWKQTLAGVKGWKEAYEKIKNLGVKYRVPLNEIYQNAVFSKCNTKSKVGLYCFR